MKCLLALSCQSYRLAREVVYTTTFSRMDNPLEGPSRRFDAATVISMIESGFFSADDSSSSSEDDYFDLSDPEATIYDHNFILLKNLARKQRNLWLQSKFLKNLIHYKQFCCMSFFSKMPYSVSNMVLKIIDKI